MIAATNDERVTRSRPALAVAAALAKAAQLHADQIASTGTFDHVIPGAAYPALADRLRAAGYAFCAAGENLAKGPNPWPAPDVVRRWMGSSGHAANILDPAFTEIGVGTALTARGELVVVQVFGSR